MRVTGRRARAGEGSRAMGVGVGGREREKKRRRERKRECGEGERETRERTNDRPNERRSSFARAVARGWGETALAQDRLSRPRGPRGSLFPRIAFAPDFLPEMAYFFDSFIWFLFFEDDGSFRICYDRDANL